MNIDTSPTETPLPNYQVKLTGKVSAPCTENILWYRAPANIFEEALPLGSGQLGVMVYGGVDEDRYGLNKDTLWAGGPYNPVNPEALKTLPEIRKLLLENRGEEAVAIIPEKFLAKPIRQMPYQSVGDLVLRTSDISVASNYCRSLNLDTAGATVEFDSNDSHFTRETFASFPRNLIATRITSSKPGKINLTAFFDSANDVMCLSQPDALILTGKNRSAYGIEGQLQFEARARFQVKSGSTESAEGKLIIRGADEVIIYTAISTSYKRFDDVTGDPAALNQEILKSIEGQSFDQLRDENSKSHQNLFRRMTIDLGNRALSDLPTDERLFAARTTDDPGLAALYFQYGRYLLISSSRGDSQPANLQGVWNKSSNPPWGSKYTININTEMNYWPADSTNLAECIEPLVKMVEDLSITGAQTAREQYRTGGWVAHHNTDLWRATAPIDGPNYGTWPTGGAWLCQNLYEHYLYTLDKNYLKRIYPLMKESARFFLENLIEDPTGKYLVTSPSLSPENTHRKGVAVCYGPAMDNQILRDLFNQCITSAKLLEIGSDFESALQTALDRLPPDRIGAQGQLQEWIEDWDAGAPDFKHRHISYLYALFPSNQIDPLQTPELAEATKVTLNARGDKTTGWAIAWRINCWARLLDGQRAHSIVKLLLDPERTYPNLFDAHPPFQIDGNFGGTSGIAEMLLQSHNNQIHFLPALPAAWKTGSITGLRARGNFSVDLSWSEGKLTTAVLTSHSGIIANLRLGGRTRSVETQPGQVIQIDADLNIR